MAGAVRESSFMPTVKCSTCGRQVEISLMGEHVCSEAAPAPTPEPMPSMLAPSLFGRLNPFAAAAPPAAPAPEDKQPRMPPEVDTSAANRSYMGPGQLTPVSGSSGSRSVSPKTPNGRPGASRSDDYFTPQIANDSPPPQQSRRPGGYGGFGDGNGFEDSMYPPKSPKKQQPNLLDRLNSLEQDPLEPARRPSAPLRMGSINDERPGTSASNISNMSGRAPRKNGYGGFGAPPTSRQDLAPEPYGMLNRSETFPRPSDAVEPPMRTPSEPGLRPDKWRRPSEASQASQDMNPRAPQTAAAEPRRPSRGPDTSRPPPPRTSLVRPRTGGRDGAPGVPAINFAEEFGVGNPYHESSASTSSSASGYSQSDRRPSMASSRTSPPRSLSSRSGRNPPKASDFDNLMSDLQSSMQEMNQSEPVSPAPVPAPALQPPREARTKTRPTPLKFRPPPPDSDRGYDPRIDPVIQSGRPRRPRSPLPPSGGDREFSDAASIQDRTRNISPVSPLTPLPPSPPRLRNSPEQMKGQKDFMPPPQVRDRSQSRPRDGPGAMQAPQIPNRSPSRSGDGSDMMPPSHVRNQSLSRPRDGSIQSSRGDCKACRLPITGKSISSADGRLTGRYHKACFVCSTCKEPFSSATFYVLEDRPYCHRHYHELNGSLCGSCDKGIEGQYLEDESAKKHHVGCFRCGDCGMALKDGYFEVNGGSYCEKDAWRRVQQPWMGNGGVRKGSSGPTLGLPSGPRAGGGFGMPNGNSRLGPPRPLPRLEKRMTRLGMM
ncbi:LIM domain containing protein [Naviculisporaceae sp. PSN 640]